MMQLNIVFVKINYFSIFFNDIIAKSPSGQDEENSVNSVIGYPTSHLGFPALVPQEKVVFLWLFGYTIDPLLTKLVWSI